MHALPALHGWDCHAHLFGPYARYPLAPARSYTPPEALEEDYARLLEQLGLGRGVLVHPSAHGADTRLVLAALAARPQWRGVLVSRDATAAQMRAWRIAGVRGLRFSHRSAAGANFAGSASIEDLQRLAPRMAAAGLHAQLWTDCQALPAIAGMLQALPVPVVLDHMGGFDHRAGVDAPGFRALLALLQDHPVWVKLCAYRNLLDAPDMELGQRFHQRLCEANAAQLVWGSDWPHLNLTPAPRTEALLQMLVRWTGDAALLHRILVDNPARLYA
jgi:predicted TIM-barrel fold metal-dependent hydrolase